MFQTQSFGSWSQLEAFALELAHKTTLAGDQFSQLLYRGQASHTWELDTTLERSAPGLSQVAEYYRFARAAKSEIETFTDRKWEDIDYMEMEKHFSEYDGRPFLNLPAYEYFAYLRHHGFPSPLLDWSRSLYVAAYFAFCRPVGGYVSIFAFQERAGHGKFGTSSTDQINHLGSNVRAHRRHFLQQGEYTICARYFGDEGWKFTKHSRAFENAHPNQDHLWQLTAPATESPAVMQQLDQYNINAYSLFQSEDSLHETVARRLLERPMFKG